MYDNAFINGVLTNLRENGTVQKLVIASPKVTKGLEFTVSILIGDTMEPNKSMQFQMSKDQAIFAQKLLQELVENFDKVEEMRTITEKKIAVVNTWMIARTTKFFYYFTSVDGKIQSRYYLKLNIYLALRSEKYLKRKENQFIQNKNEFGERIAQWEKTKNIN